MNYFKTHKIIALFLAVLMILPLIPAVDLTVFAEGTMAVTTESLQDDIGRVATINPDVNLFGVYKNASFEGNTVTVFEDGQDSFTTPDPQYYSLDIEFLIEDVYVSDVAIFYKVSVLKQGILTPDIFNDYPWLVQRYVDMEGDTLILGDKYVPDAPVIPEGTVLITDANGNAISTLAMNKYDKPVLTAATAYGANASYSWQIEYAPGQWVDIYGEDSAIIKISYGMVAQLLDANSSVNVRCEITVGNETIYSAPVSVTVYETTRGSMSIPRTFADDTTEETTGTNVSDPVTITINFVYGSDPNKLVAEPVVSTIQKGTPYELLDYKLPVMEGYDAYLGDDTTTIYTEIDMPATVINENITVTFKYWPAKVNYTVIYYWQNADNDDYTEHERVVLTDFTGNITTVEDKEYDGFYQLLYETVPIASDGSTVIEVYYDRYYYLMLFNLEGGYGVQPIYARYEATLPTLTPAKAGCDFVGWDSDADSDSLADSNFPTTMPLGNSNYTAVWQYSKNKVDVHIVVWGENPNDEGYSYIKSDTIQVAPGTEINYKNAILTCTQEEHTHSEDCHYQCGLQEHTHSQANGCALFCTHQHNISCVTSSGRTNRSPSSNDQSAIGDTATGIRSGYVYKIEVSGDDSDYYYLRYDDVWYLWENPSNNGANVVDGVAIETITKDIKTGGILGIGGSTRTWTVTVYKVKYANCTHNTHTDACYTCDKTPHTHSDSCGYACGKNYHKHSNSCYASDDLMESDLWTLVKSDTVTVAPDGSTIMNVYYDRTEFTMTFRKSGSTNGTVLATITDKWGAKIKDRFQDICNANTFLWSRTSDGEDPWTSFMDIMPQEDRTYYAYVSSSSYAQSATYYVQNVNKTGYDEYFTTNVKYSNTLYVSEEEIIDIEGYKYSYGTTSNGTNINLNSNNSYKYDGSEFYYNRKSFLLQFHDNGETGIIDELTKTVVYEGSLAAYADIVLTADDAPAKYEPGSVAFAGWYTNPEGEGDPFDFANEKMPASTNDGDPALILYAKWAPVTHTVRFYTDEQYVGTNTIYSYVDSNGETKEATYEVPHGSKIQDPLTPPNDPEKGQYEFNGWYYIDASGNEQRWDFKNTTVTRNVDVYAKWSSNKLMPYTIKYVYVDENKKEIEIADRITGSALGGNSKTFDAKANEQLYKDYQEGYFPTTQSHTIVIDLENTANNEFTFYYVKRDAVPYTVYYVTETPKEGSNLSTVELNGKTYYVLKDAVTHADNKKAIVTETYVPIAGYLPNNYQETLIINPEATEDNPNQIIFVYSIDEKHSMYIVHYYFKDVTGNNYVENMDYFFQSKAEISSTVSAAIPTIDNFTHNPNVTGTLLSGTIEKDKILELHVYYDRNTYPYKVQYLERGTLRELRDTKIVRGSYWESSVTEKYIEVADYTLDSEAEVTIEIRKDTENPTVNIITFWYVKDSVINYVLVKPAGATDKYCELTSPFETVKGSTGKPQGSGVSLYGTAYTFVGWFTDANCTNPVTGGILAGTHYVPADRTAATYYAKVVEVTVDIKYEVVGPTGAINFGTVTDDNLKVPVLTGTPSGTAAPNAPTFKFVGWYDNKACTGNPISTDLTYVPQKTQNYHNDKDGNEILGHYAATYYAKFEYNLTSLTITKTGWNSVDPNQTFIFNVSGGDVNVDVTIHGDGSVTIYGLTVGQEYTITEKTNWSWRYECTAAGYSGTGVSEASTLTLDSASLYIPALGVSDNFATFTNTRKTEYWLDGDSWCDNRFMANVTQAIN